MGRLFASTFIWTFGVLGFLIVAELAGLVELTGVALAILLICALCELADSSLGMGYGTTLTPVLLLLGYEPLQLVPTILVSEFLSGFSSAFFHTEAGNVRLNRGSKHLQAAAVLSIGSFLGVFTGVELALNVPRETLTLIISVVILGAGLYILVFSHRTFVYRTWKIVLLAIPASFNKAISGGGYGPLMTTGQMLSGVEGKAAVAITSFAEGFTCLAATSLFLLQGLRLDVELLVPVVTGALLAVPWSAQIVRRLPERTMKRAVALLTIVLGLLILTRSLA